PPSHVTLHFGSAFASPPPPVAVTFVLARRRSVNSPSPARWASPASVTGVSVRSRTFRFWQPLKAANPASVTSGLLPRPARVSRNTLPDTLLGNLNRVLISVSRLISTT